MNEFLNMGGYAAYVWSSYGLAFVVLLLNVVLPRIQRRRIQHRLAARIRQRAGQ